LQGKADAADAQASTLEQGVKDVDEKMAKGLFECKGGHEIQFIRGKKSVKQIAEDEKFCTGCGKPTKLVRTDLLTGQEKYDNEKERREVEKMAEASRQAAQIRKEIERQQGDIENQRTQSNPAIEAVMRIPDLR
jgi:hypothetical protein